MTTPCGELAGCTVEPLAPFGQLIRPQVSGASLPGFSADLRQRLLTERLLVWRGFAPFTEQATLAEYARCWGPLLEWSFGNVFEVVEQPAAANYLFTSGSVPFHWDGAFAAQTPWLQLFQCVEAPGVDAGGETLFCDTARAWNAASDSMRARWQEVEFEYATEKVAHYGGRIRARLAGSHPLTGDSVLRYNEPANATTASLNTPEVTPLGIQGPAAEQLLSELRTVLYNPAWCYAHSWMPGDLLLADNFVLLHGRQPYRTRTPRRLWRVHILPGEGGSHG